MKINKVNIFNIDIPWNRYALIAELADRFKNACPQFGKTALQKMVYLLQELYGVKGSYGFSLYTYGPFSSQLLQDLDFVDTAKGVDVCAVSGTRGYLILPGEQNRAIREKAKDFLSKPEVQKALDTLVADFGGYWAKDLELRSTIVYVDRDANRTGKPLTRDELVQMVSEIKSHFSKEEICQAVAELEFKGYILRNDHHNNGECPDNDECPEKEVMNG